MLRKVNKVVPFELHTLGMEEVNLSSPTRSGSPGDVHDAMAGQMFSSRCIPQCPAYHA